MNQLRIHEIGEFHDTEAPGFDGEPWVSRLRDVDIAWNLFPPVPPSPEANDFSTSTLNGEISVQGHVDYETTTAHPDVSNPATLRLSINYPNKQPGTK